jgi:hypothetical protein
MKKVVGIVAVSAILLVCFACQQRRNISNHETAAVQPEAQGVWQYITDTNPYTDWRYFPGYEGMYPGQSPHGAYLKLYVNDTAYRAAKDGTTMPDGAILVKENYGKDKQTLMAVTPMYKVDGYNPSADDWFWAKYGANGDVMAAGKVNSCIQCHRSAKGGDYLFTEPK